MLNGSDFDDKCFVEGLEYEEGAVITKYGKCLGYYECAKKDLLTAVACASENEDSFDSDRFLEGLKNHTLECPFPRRLCTEGKGGFCRAVNKTGITFNEDGTIERW